MKEWKNERGKMSNFAINTSLLKICSTGGTYFLDVSMILGLILILMILKEINKK